MIAGALPVHSAGGVQDHTWMLATGLVRRGHEVAILTTGLDGNPAEATREGVSVLHLAGTRPGIIDAAWRAASADAAAALHASSPLDLIHCQGFAGYGLVRAGAPGTLRVPLVVTQHGTYYDELVTRLRNFPSANPVRIAKNIGAIFYIFAVIAARDRRYLQSASGVIATSEEQYALLRRVYGIESSRLYKVYNGIDMALFDAGEPSGTLRSRLGIPGSAKIVLAVARLIRDKGVQNIINAMPAILKGHPSSALVVVGDGPHREELETLANSRAPRSVFFAGDVPASGLPEYYRTCDLFVNPTNQQNGYDLTMVQAMACGRAVVASGIGSVPTLIRHGSDGILVPPGDVGALATEVSRLLGDGRLASELGARARARVREYFTLEGMLDGTIAVYERIAAGRAA